MTAFGPLLPPAHRARVTMRLLFVSNYFPPHALGGYELQCQDVARALTQRGHTVQILTSRPPSAEPVVSPDVIAVHRVLHLEVVGGLLSTTARLWVDRRRHAAENVESVQAVLAQCRPDVALFWGLWNVPRAVPALIEDRMADRVAYYMSDYWPTLPSAYLQQWQAPSRRLATRLVKRLLRGGVTYRLAREADIPLRYARVICVSRAVRERLVRAGLSVADAPVIYGGTAVAPSDRHEHSHAPPDAPFSLVSVGRLVAEKGVHTIIDAVHALRVQRPRVGVTLDIVGSGDPGYTSRLRRAIRRHGLQGAVRLRGRVDSGDVPEVLARHGALVLASEWDEPFSRVVLEAMAVGTPVIGTTTGGTPEVLVDGVTGLTFRPGDAMMLAAQIARLQRHPAERRALARAARETVAARFTLARSVDELEGFLARLAAPHAV